MEQAWLSVCQATPAGSVSLISTPYAVPSPSFQTEIVNDAVWPAAIGLLSAVLSRTTSGQATTTSSVACGSQPALDANAVLTMSPQLSAVVPLTMRTLVLAPASSVAGPNL